MPVTVAFKITAVGGNAFERRILHQLPEKISFLLQEGRQRQVGLFIRDIFRYGNLFGCVAGEAIELVHFPEFFHQ